jgi:hypothetical protein
VPDARYVARIARQSVVGWNAALDDADVGLTAPAYERACAPLDDVRPFLLPRTAIVLVTVPPFAPVTTSTTDAAYYDPYDQAIHADLYLAFRRLRKRHRSTTTSSTTSMR